MFYKDVREDLEKSLENLRTDYIDIYLAHRDDEQVSVEEIVEAFNALHAEGKIGAFGGSNWTHQRSEESNEYAYKHDMLPFTVSSPNFGLAEQVKDLWGGGSISISGPAVKQVAPAGDILPAIGTVSLESVIDNALSANIQVVSAGLAVKESKYNYMKAKGSWFPTISLSGGVGTSYYTNFNSSAYPAFWTQLDNNRGGYVGVSMSIPIFSNLSRKASVRSSRNALRNAELEMEATRNAVESEVVQACRQMEGYGKQYIQAVKKIEAAKLAYDGIAAKFEKGLVTAIELQMSATTLMQAKSDCLRSKLQYMIEKRMVDYYSGIPLVEVK